MIDPRAALARALFASPLAVRCRTDDGTETRVVVSSRAPSDENYPDATTMRSDARLIKLPAVAVVGLCPATPRPTVGTLVVTLDDDGADALSLEIAAAPKSILSGHVWEVEALLR